MKVNKEEITRVLLYSALWFGIILTIKYCNG
jgi:hypothetical protein